MEVNGHIQAPEASAPEKEQPVLIGQEAGWAPEPDWAWWQKNKSLPLLGKEPQSSRP